jgi:hypothetical protein
MAQSQDITAAKQTYEGFIRLIKISTPIIAILAAFVVYLPLKGLEWLKNCVSLLFVKGRRGNARLCDAGNGQEIHGLGRFGRGGKRGGACRLDC